MTGAPAELARRAITPAEAAALVSGQPENGATTRLRADLVACFASGPRAILLSGLDPSQGGEAGFERALLALGSWLGEASIQSPGGELVARVERNPADVQARGTHSDDELQGHTDLHDILALACVRPAASGGESFLVGADALHAQMQGRHAESIAALQEGYYFGTNPVLQSDHPVSEDKVPVLFDGTRKLICWNGYFMRMAAERRGEALPEALARALDKLRAEAARLAEICRFKLRTGDILFWHNWSWLHGRTAFRDTDNEPRRLLRLWLRSDQVDRPPILAQRGARIDADHRLTQRLGYRL